MATVLAIINEFCDRINQPREASYVTATTPAARQYVSLLKFVGGEILKSNPSGWYQLKRAFGFVTVQDQFQYQLPGDFYQMLAQTTWSFTNQLPLSGPLSNASLAFRTYGMIPSGVYTGFQVNGAQGYIFNTTPYTQRSAGWFEVSPPSQADGEENIIAYTSRNWVWPRDWTANTAYSLLDIRSGDGYVYICTTAGTSGGTRPSNATGTVNDGSVVWTVYHEPYPITADTDFCLFDDELLTEGLRWAWYRSKKQGYEKEWSDWQQSVRVAAARQNGGVVVNAGYNTESQYEWPNVPMGAWPGTGDV